MTTPDTRMLWIRNLEAFSAAPGADVLEAEVASELYIPGLLKYADGAVVFRLTAFEPDVSGLYKYVLRIRLATTQSPMPKGTRQGYLFREGPLGELVALFSLRLQARFFILSTAVRRPDTDDLPWKTEFAILRGKTSPSLDTIVFAPAERNLDTDLTQFLEDVRSVLPRHQLEVIVAASHYARALREIGVDEEMVFVRLVSAIERLAEDQALPDDPLNGTSLEDLVRMDLLTEDQIEELRKMLRTRRAKSRFISFLQEYSGGFFDAERRDPPHTPSLPMCLRHSSPPNLM